MNDSLAWLRDPTTGPALPGLLCGLIRDIRLILVHPDMANAAKLAAITQAVDQVAPPPGTQPADPQAAASVVALLTRGTFSRNSPASRSAATSPAAGTAC